MALKFSHDHLLMKATPEKNFGKKCASVPF